MRIQKHLEEMCGLLNRQELVAQLLVPLFVGYFFVETEWGKLHNLDGFAQRFAGWGIPHPYFNAALSAYTEFIGGMLTMFGIGTRLVAIPMIMSMLIAILKVDLKRVATLDDFVELDEPLYAVAYVWLRFSGAGWVSVDYPASRDFGLTGCSARRPSPATHGKRSHRDRIGSDRRANGLARGEERVIVRYFLPTSLLASAVGVVPSQQLPS
jgi:putative oxidoreductase